ncbi:MAG TPA: hypothetical protein VH481_11390 [Nitrososphaeraceae archaeon]|jgi:hypothetical protein
MISNEENYNRSTTRIFYQKYKIVQKELDYQPMCMRMQERAIDETIATCSETRQKPKKEEIPIATNGHD